MSFLLDTNTVSELSKEKPSASVVAWLRRNHRDCFISAVTIGELVKGIELLPESKKRRRLAREFRYLQEDCLDRILPGDDLTAVEWDAYTLPLGNGGGEERVVPAVWRT